MQVYTDLNGDSGIAAFEIGDDYIHVQFKTGATYSYTYGSAGQHVVEEMKRFALAGDGLNSYIMRNARTSYASKW